VPVVASPGNNRHPVGNNFNKRRQGKGAMLTNQKNRFRPTLECLEAREVMSSNLGTQMTFMVTPTQVASATQNQLAAITLT
jgi:hypothetical protein